MSAWKWLSDRLNGYDLKEWSLDLAFAFGIGLMAAAGAMILFGGSA